MRALNKLSATQVKNYGAGKYSDGGGLWLHKRTDGRAQWVLRVTVHSRRREMGLGSQQHISLMEARIAAEKWRAVVHQGKDPIKEREREKREAAKAGRWFTPLHLHVLPKIGRVPIEDIDQQDIKNTLAPIWHIKSDTARNFHSCAPIPTGTTLRFHA